jgi:hypothetical protein
MALEVFLKHDVPTEQGEAKEFVYPDGLFWKPTHWFACYRDVWCVDVYEKLQVAGFMPETPRRAICKGMTL